LPSSGSEAVAVKTTGAPAVWVVPVAGLVMLTVGGWLTITVICAVRD
jgi:hypothetical protein